MSSYDPALIRAYLENALTTNKQEAEALVRHAIELLDPLAPMVLPTYGVGLDTGIKRAGKPNEDYAFATAFPGGGLFVVADGMGGHANGRVASHLAVHTIVDFLLPQLHESLQEQTILALLAQGVQRANQTIFAKNAVGAKTDADRMGTTISVAISVAAKLYVANVGDSRTYILRHGEALQKITRDHSVVADLVAKGDLRPEEVYTHPKRNQIYRNLGNEPLVPVDLFYEEIEEGDIVLLCSDGLWEMVPEAWLIEETLRRIGFDAKQRAERLVQLARDEGGADNIGVIVVDIQLSGLADMPTITFATPSPATLSHF